MKLSVETKVAAGIGAGFIALTAIAIAQGNSVGETGGPNGYGPRNNPEFNTYMSQRNTIARYSHRRGLMRFVCNEVKLC